VTTLGRAWMPLLRYDIGDLVRPAPRGEACACGRADEGFLLERVEGRANDAVEKNGALLTPAGLDDIVDAADETIAQWQLARGNEGGAESWVFHVVGSADGGARAAAALSHALGAPVEARPASLIQPEASGKYRIVR